MYTVVMTYYFPFPADVHRSQLFGAPQRNAVMGDGAPHGGDDYATPVGTPVYAAGDGVIDYAGWFDASYEDNYAWNTDMAGLLVWLNCGDNAPSFEYGHLSVTFVVPRQRVRAGDIIALTGNTGGSTGPHCHVGCLPPRFTLNTPTFGRVDPKLYMTRYWDGGITLASHSISIIEAATTETGETAMSTKILATDGVSPQVWLGDGILRRPVWTLDTMANVQWLADNDILGPFYQDGTVQSIPDLNSIGIDVMALVGKDVNGR